MAQVMTSDRAAALVEIVEMEKRGVVSTRRIVEVLVAEEQPQASWWQRLKRVVRNQPPVQRTA